MNVSGLWRVWGRMFMSVFPGCIETSKADLLTLMDLHCIISYMCQVSAKAFACCRKGWGKTVVLGVDKPGAKLTLSSAEVLGSGKTLTGCLFGGLKPKSDVPMLVKQFLDKELELDNLRCIIWMDQTK
ncbi:hypothetical protein POM88_016779 [Heracleum sosnowskyi]|uniref:Uncharacterized protein n=1 Tax=Heracleum sosnowskyi TaxID=360622 RepID=A0AAD8IPJ7_9APIA|nr:hypothetical protein POM88_016779 [Heracleum sosnowskyi]